MQNKILAGPQTDLLDFSKILSYLPSEDRALLASLRANISAKLSKALNSLNSPDRSFTSSVNYLRQTKINLDSLAGQLEKSVIQLRYAGRALDAGKIEQGAVPLVRTMARQLETIYLKHDILFTEQKRSALYKCLELFGLRKPDKDPEFCERFRAEIDECQPFWDGWKNLHSLLYEPAGRGHP
ncbi:MAG: hypothetical protein LBD99_06460 [Candidatus Margulisbacteria bacterium]|jgi:hypothetical protein|nr:hypothetical protein [Candidatus Margulisiibacteriota bacterium]